MVLKGRVVMDAQPLVGRERDEITAMVSRIKRADERARSQPSTTQVAPAAPAAEDVKWAEDWQLPREVFEYFVLERVN